MVTIQDVARAARVSAMTVSNVLNNSPRVRASTRARVLEAIERLDYRVNVAARNLRAGRTRTIGFAVPEVDRPYFGQLAARIIARADAAGYRVVIEQTRADREYELRAIASSRNRLYDGLILSAVGLSDRDRELLRADTPTVLLGETVFTSPFDHIAMPNEEGTHAATRHLIDRGCRRLAFVGADEVDLGGTLGLRYQGFRKALAEAGFEHDPSLSIGVEEVTTAAGQCAGQRVAARADGVVCITDTVALGVIRGLADAGVRVPEDVRVIGFDGIEDGLFSVPRLSTVATDHDGLATLAIERLLRQIERDPEWEPCEFVVDFTVEERESTR